MYSHSTLFYTTLFTSISISPEHRAKYWTASYPKRYDHHLKTAFCINVYKFVLKNQERGKLFVNQFKILQIQSNVSCTDRLIPGKLTLNPLPGSVLSSKKHVNHSGLSFALSKNKHLQQI